MAALTAAGVTLNDAWKGGGPSGRRFLHKDVTLALVAQGGLTNSVDASTLGFTKIMGVSTEFRTSASVVILAVPSFDGSKLAFITAETAGTPIDQTATVRGTVFGYDS